MNQDVAINIAMDAVVIALKVALPLMMVALVVGLAISIFQAITQIQEMTLSYIPKILATIAVMVVAGPWMLGQVTTYTTELYRSIPGLVGP